MAISEFSFSVDDFKSPKVYKNPKAVAVLLTRLLLLEPGTIQSHPEMGVGLYSNFMYGMEGTTASNLKSSIQKQITTYLPDFQSLNVSVVQKENTLYITIEIDGYVYGFVYNADKQTLINDYTKLSEL